MTTEEKILVKLEADAGSFLMVMDRAFAKIKKLSDSFTRFNSRVSEFSRAYSAMGNQVIDDQKMLGSTFENTYGQIEKSLKPLGDAVKESMIEPVVNADMAVQGILDKQTDMANFSREFANGYRKMGHKVENLSTSMGRFKMEMLGVMFFGMMMQRFFVGLLRPVMETFGVFELFNVMLQVLFLPVMMALFEPLLNLIAYLMELPDGAKMVIGVLTLLGAIFGTVLMVIGQMTLGLASLVMALEGGSILGALGTLTSIQGILATIAGVGTIFVTVGLVIGGFTGEGTEEFNPWGDIGIAAATALGLKLAGSGMGWFKLTGGIFSLVVGLDLLFMSLSKEGLDVWEDLFAAVAIGMGVKILGFKMGSVGISALFILFVGLDMAFSAINKPAMQWWQDILAAVLTGLGVAGVVAAAGAGAATVVAAGVIALAASMIIYFSLDWVFDKNRQKKIPFQRSAFGYGEGMIEMFKDAGIEEGLVSFPTVPSGLNPSVFTGTSGIKQNNINVTQNISVNTSFQEEIDRLRSDWSDTLVEEIKKGINITT